VNIAPEPQAGYRPCVGIALFNRQGRVFVGRRSGLVADAGAWQMPQGGVDDGEDPLAAARRELREETGVADAALLGRYPGWLAYDLPDDMIRPKWRGRWRGQTQAWFAFRLEGPDSLIDIDHGHDGQPPEFSAWRWERLAATPDLIVAFKRPVYVEIARYFAGFSVLP
jgi:putative (di)nucleoside polyphosphate hydrolase